MTLLDLLMARRGIRGRFFLVIGGMVVLSILTMALLGVAVLRAMWQQHAIEHGREAALHIAEQIRAAQHRNTSTANLLTHLPSVGVALQTGTADTLPDFFARALAIASEHFADSDVRLLTVDGIPRTAHHHRDRPPGPLRRLSPGMELEGDRLMIVGSSDLLDEQGHYVATLEISTDLLDVIKPEEIPGRVAIGLALAGGARLQPYQASPDFGAWRLAASQSREVLSGRTVLLPARGHGDGREIAGALPLMDADGTILGVVEFHDLVSPLDGDHGFLWLGAAGSVTLLGAGLLLAFWGSHRVTASLRRLSEVTRHFAEGDLSSTVPDTTRQDELGQTARALLALREAMLKGREAEQSFRRIAGHHKLATDIADIATWYLDTSTGRPVWSKRMRALFGLPEDLEASVPALIDAVHPEDRPAFLAVREARIASAQPVAHEFRVVWRDGSIHWLRSVGGTVRDESRGTADPSGAVINIDERKRIEAERATLTERLLRFEAEERVRLARDLHDRIAQNLAGLSLGLKMLEGELDEEDARRNIAWLQELLRDISVSVHRTAEELHPTSIEDLGVTAAIEHHVAQWSAFNGTFADCYSDLGAARLDPELERATFGFHKEVLDDIAADRRATRVSVTLEAVGRELRLIIESDAPVAGPAAAARADPPRASWLGLGERLAALGGRIELEQGRAGGSSVHLHIPLSEKVRETI